MSYSGWPSSRTRGRLVVGVEVVAEPVSAAGDRDSRDGDRRSRRSSDGDARHGSAAEPAAARACAGHACPAGARSTPPVEERDPEEVPRDAQREARARPHPRAAPVVPADRHDRDPVAAPPGEVDELDVEDDARDLLAREQVVRRPSRVKPLNPHWVSWTGPTTQTEASRWNALPEQPPVARLAARACPSRRAGSGCRARRRGRPGPRRGAGAGRAAWPCRRRRRRQVRLGGEHPGPDGRALAAVRHPGAQQRDARRAGRRGLGRARTSSAVPSVLPSSTTRTWIVGRQLATSRARRRGPARRVAAGSRTARRAPARSAPPRCTRAGRS